MRKALSVLWLLAGLSGPLSGQNLVINGDFASTVAQWDAYSSWASVQWSPADASASTASGSAEVANARTAGGPEQTGVVQCVPVTAGVQYRLEGSLYIPGGQPAGHASLALFWYSGGCGVSNQLGADQTPWRSVTDAGSINRWIAESKTAPARPGSRSVGVALWISKSATDEVAVRARFDDVRLTVATSQPPASIFLSGPTSGEVGQALTFTASASGCTPSTTGWTWGLAGGTASGAANGSSITVAWSNVGTKALSATNSACGGTQGGKSVTITGPAPGPVLSISGPESGRAGEQLTFRATASNCSPASTGWRWESQGATGSSSTDTIALSWLVAGDKVLAVTNAACGSAVDTHRIRIAPVGKVAVFLIHGIDQGKEALIPLAANLRSALNSSEFTVDSGFDFGDCAKNSKCPATCTIQSAAQRLAEHVNRVAPSGDIALVGYSMGGLVAREMLIRNAGSVIDKHRVRLLVTLGTPNVGYPGCAEDVIVKCDYLALQMLSYLRSERPTVSEYLFDLIQAWSDPLFASRRPEAWLAVAGTYCPQPQRICAGSLKQGCPNASPTSDGVVCKTSALASGIESGPSRTWPSNKYRHTEGKLTWLLLCRSKGISLYNPPMSSDLFSELVSTLRRTAPAAARRLPDPIASPSSPNEPGSDESVLLPPELDPGPAATVSRMDEFLRGGLDGLEIDQALVDIATNPQELVPRVIAWCESRASSASRPAVSRAADLLAFAASTEAVEALARMAGEEPTFREALVRSFGYSWDRSNPFDLVYAALQVESIDKETRRAIVEWAESHIMIPQVSDWWRSSVGRDPWRSTPSQDPLLRDLSKEQRQFLISESELP